MQNAGFGGPCATVEVCILHPALRMQNAGFGGPRATVELKFMNRGDEMHEFSNCGHRFDARENLPSMERVISNVRDFTTHDFRVETVCVCWCGVNSQATRLRNQGVTGDAKPY